MSLFPCPECGRMISEEAISCPQCGYVLLINQCSRVEIKNDDNEDLSIVTSEGRKYYINRYSSRVIDVYENGKWQFKYTVSHLFSDDETIYGDYFIVKQGYNATKRLTVKMKTEGILFPFTSIVFKE